ncbi:hypothetical protein RRG08_032051 [Elysia crispata]|uniref:Uncharacterized protein n=1 Tax=Elysia crispata TaxID=231223 RepID=A0AAE0ZH23_9GAST|nr:hypothetical protein RRG08_032051 [Elysia crispata]
MGRRTQSHTPATSAVLQPFIVPQCESHKMEHRRHKSAQRTCFKQTLAPLQPGDHVRMEPIDGRNEWKPATVTKTLPHNNYEVWDGNRSFIRGRKFLRKKPLPDHPTQTKVATPLPSIPYQLQLACPQTERAEPHQDDLVDEDLSAPQVSSPRSSSAKIPGPSLESTPSTQKGAQAAWSSRGGTGATRLGQPYPRRYRQDLDDSLKNPLDCLIKKLHALSPARHYIASIIAIKSLSLYILEGPRPLSSSIMVLFSLLQFSLITYNCILLPRHNVSELYVQVL